MAVPTLITDLSRTAASNSPSGSDNVFPDLDNFIRAQSAFIRQLYDAKGSVSVSDYGAVGDGVTDDTAAIEACIAAAGVGRTILFPAGVNCKVASEVDLNVAGQKIIGYGAKITKAATFTGTGVLRIGATNVTLEGLEIDGTDQAIDGLITSAGLASGFNAKNLKISNCLYGISANSNSNVLIEGCNISSTARNCIRVHNTAATAALTNIRVINNTLDMSSSVAATSTYQCLMVWGAPAFFTTNVSVSSNLMTHVYDPTNSAAEICEFRFVDNGVFDGNTCINGSMMVSVGCCNNVTVSGNSGLNQTFYGIEFGGLTTSSGATVNQPCTNCSATGNSIKGGDILNYGVGIQGTYPSKGISVAGNSIEGTTLYGVFVNDQWKDISISGNRIDISDTVSGSQYGVYCFGTATLIEEIVVTGNVLNGNNQGEKAVFLLNVQYATITGNVCPNWNQNGVYISGSLATCDEISVVGNSFKGLGANGVAKNGTLGDKVTSYGNTGYRRTNTTATNDLNLNLDLLEAWGTGTPEAAVTAGVGSIFHRTNGGAATSLYIKETGTGSTGWVAK